MRGKNRVLPVGDNDRNEVSCSDQEHSIASRVRIDQESNTFPAELSVLILFKMIESIDMILCVISFLVYNYSSKLCTCNSCERRKTTAFTNHKQGGS